MLDTAQPKPRRRASVKRAVQRAEAKVIQQVRADCVTRDGYCRLIWGRQLQHDEQHGAGLDSCGIRSEWAHLNEHQRFKTRGQAPEERHCTQGSLMLCDVHHHMLDSHTMTITPLSERGADGPLQFASTQTDRPR